MITRFYNGNKALLGVAGFVATMCGLFLNIAESKIEKANNSLEDIKIFWILSLVTMIILVFVRLNKAIYRECIKLGHKYDLPLATVVTFSSIYAGLFIVMSLLNYVTLEYPKSGYLLGMISLTAIVMAVAVLPLCLMEKWGEKYNLFTKISIYSLSASILFAFSGSLIIMLYYGFVEWQQIRIIFLTLYALVFGAFTFFLFKNKGNRK